MIYINIHPINRLGLQGLHWLLIVFAFAVPAGVWAQDAGNDAALSQLSLTLSTNAITLTLNPTFSPDQTNYEANVPPNRTLVTVRAEVRDSDASLKISPSDAADLFIPGHQVNIHGETNIVVTVTAEDGVTTQTYTVRLINPKVTLVVTPSRINADGGVATVTATMSLPQTAQQVEVTLAAEAVPPATNATFTLSNFRTLNFLLNTTTSTGTVTITAVNTNSEMLEHAVRISGTPSATKVSIVNAPILTIDDDDQRVILNLNPTTVAENAGQTTVAVTATLDGATRPVATTVTVSVAGGTAIAGTDFTAVQDFTVTIPANMQSGSERFLLNPLDDDDDEAAETLIVSGAATGLNVIGATLQLTDNDPPRVSIQAVNSAVEEGNLATFTLSRGSHHLNEELVVNITVTQHGDFIDGTPPTTVTFASGNTEATLSVPTEDDQYREVTSATHRIYHPEALENDGSVTATIAQGTRYLPAIGSSSSATVQVEENDLPLITMRPDPSIIGSDPDRGNILEGEEFAIYIDRTGNDEARLDVSFRLSAVCSGEESGSYTPNAWPFSSGASGVRVESAVLESGRSTVKYALSTENEDIYDCHVWVTATSIASSDFYSFIGFTSPGIPTNTSLPAAARVLVRNDDGLPELTIADAEANEDDGTISFTATLSGSRNATPLDIAWEATSTVNSIHGTATMGEDYGRDAHGVLNFNALERGNREFTVPIIDDVTDEENETFFIHAAYRNQTATGTIIDNDATSTRIALSASPHQVLENAWEPPIAVEEIQPITVTAILNEGARTEATPVTVSVSGVTATAVTDFEEVDDFILTIPPNVKSGTGAFTLIPVNDVIMESDETVAISGAATNLTVDETYVTIIDDDTPPQVWINPVQTPVFESDANGACFAISTDAVFLSTADQIVVDVAVVMRGVFSLQGNRTHNVTMDSQTKNLCFDLLDDRVAESEGSFTATIASRSHYNIGDPGSATIRILDNDSASITLSVSPDQISEDGGRTRVAVSFTRLGPSYDYETETTLITYSIQGLTATQGTDFSPVSSIQRILLILLLYQWSST